MPYVWVRDFPPTGQVRRIQSGDTLGVTVRGQSDLSGSYVVRENGTILQPLLGEVLVTGLTEIESAKRFATVLKGVVIKPKVSITILKPRPVRIAVTGEVGTPGNFTVEYDETVLSVIARAGGLTPYADRSGIYVLRKRPKLVRVRFTYDDLKGGDLASSTFELHDNDVIVVE
ncbi:MAG: polysaccharide biosynthesis/export family protein [Myxococcales bacterium]|nr:polysaccharide biosynthesis/export family protein [Myxococcales bacterium]